MAETEVRTERVPMFATAKRGSTRGDRICAFVHPPHDNCQKDSEDGTIFARLWQKGGGAASQCGRHNEARNFCYPHNRIDHGLQRLNLEEMRKGVRTSLFPLFSVFFLIQEGNENKIFIQRMSRRRRQEARNLSSHFFLTEKIKIKN